MKLPLFIDTETTGFGDCRLIELAWATYNGNIQVRRFKPPIPIEEQAIGIHGITDEMLEGCNPFSDDPQYAEIKTLLENSCVIGHNVQFDIDVLAREGIFITESVDTKKIAKKLYRSFGKYGLQSLREMLSLETSGDAHSAAGDVAVLRQLAIRMFADAAKL